MKRASRHLLRTLCVAFLFASCASVAAAQAQTRDRHVISARAGVINYVSGEVTARRRGQTAWREVSDSDTLVSGDTLRTGVRARAEILLNPGSYLRLGEGAELTLVDGSLDRLWLKLIAGSAIVEATGFGGGEVSLTVETPHASVAVVKNGLYRFNVVPLSMTEFAVVKGRALVGPGRNMLTLKSKRVARFGAGGLMEVAKLDTRQRDWLDEWSRQRAETLAQANRGLSRPSMNAMLASVDWDDFFSATRSHGRYGLNDLSRGVWLFDQTRGCYIFVPGSVRSSSPYGFGFGNSLYVNPHGGPPRNICTTCGGQGSGGGIVASNGNGAGGGTQPNPSPLVVVAPGGQQGTPVLADSEGTLYWRIDNPRYSRGGGGGGSASSSDYPSSSSSSASSSSSSRGDNSSASSAAPAPAPAPVFNQPEPAREVMRSAPEMQRDRPVQNPRDQ